MKPVPSADPMEARVAELLQLLGFDFGRDPRETKALDFVVRGTPPVYVEAKQHHADRIARQMAVDPNVVAFQGIAAVERFIAALQAPDRARLQQLLAARDEARDELASAKAKGLPHAMVDDAERDLGRAEAALFAAITPAAAPQAVPIPMVLHCPSCGLQHVDAPEPEAGWFNPPHRSHKCHGCGSVWRPADVATVGVARIATRGAADTLLAPGAGAGCIAWKVAADELPDVAADRPQEKVVFVVPGSDIVWNGMYTHRWPDQPPEESCWSVWYVGEDRMVIWEGPEPSHWAYARPPRVSRSARLPLAGPATASGETAR